MTAKESSLMAVKSQKGNSHEVGNCRRLVQVKIWISKCSAREMMLMKLKLKVEE
jgi:hypothetical protein